MTESAHEKRIAAMTAEIDDLKNQRSERIRALLPKDVNQRTLAEAARLTRLAELDESVHELDQRIRPLVMERGALRGDPGAASPAMFAQKEG